MVTRCFDYEAVADRNSSLAATLSNGFNMSGGTNLNISCDFKLNSTSLGALPYEGLELTW